MDCLNHFKTYGGYPVDKAVNIEIEIILATFVMSFQLNFNSPYFVLRSFYNP